MPSLRIGMRGDLSLPASGLELDFELNSLDSRDPLAVLGDFGGTGGGTTEICEAARSVNGLVYWLSGE